MLLPSIRIPAFLLLGFLVTSSQGQTSTLYADGLLHVRGAEWQETRVTVVPEFGDPFEIPLSGEHFELDMGLESSYLVRAVHSDCAAKEVMFDLRVPAQYRTQDFHFPFEILLEVFKPKEEPYAYAKPVGAVFFDPAKEDFTYTTDYQRIEQARSVSTLIERMDTHIRLNPNPVNALAGYQALFDQDPNALPLPVKAQAIAVSDSIGSPVADSIPIRPVPATEVLPLAVATIAGPSLGKVNYTAMPAATPAPPVVGEAAESAMLPRAALLPVSRISTHFALEPTKAQQARHEFQKLPTMYILIDRFGNSDSTMELRKVTHAYGAVFYFQDGQAITERAYAEEMAKHADPALTDR